MSLNRTVTSSSWDIVAPSAPASSLSATCWGTNDRRAPTEVSFSTTAACRRFMSSTAEELPAPAWAAILMKSSVTLRSTASWVVPFSNTSLSS